MIFALWPLILGAFALGLDAYVLAGLLPAMADDLQTTQAMVGLGVGLFTAAYAISAPILSSVSARLSTRATLLAGLGLFTLGNLVTMLAPSLSVLLTARLIAGIGAGLYSPLATSSAAAMVNNHQRGRALSAILAGLSIGTALGVPLGLWIENSFGWRWTIGLIVLFGLIAISGVVKQTRLLPASPVIHWRTRFEVLGSPFIRSTLGVTLCTGIASLGLYTYLAEVLSARQMGEFINVFIWSWGVGGMAGALAIGRIIDRYLAPRKATFMLLALLFISLNLVGYAPAVMTGIGCFLWGMAGWSSLAPQQHALVMYSPDHATVSIAWNSSANYLGSAIGVASGAIILHSRLAAFWLPAGAAVIIAIAILLHFFKPRDS